MKIHEIVFSPTGGTRAVADVLSSAIGAEVVVVDITQQAWTGSSVALAADDVAVIAMPSFGGRVPVLAARRLAQLDGAGAKAVIVCVYGNRAYEDTLVELQDAAEQAGFKVIAAVAAIAEHSIAHIYGTGRPDEDDKWQLAEFAATIKRKIGSGGYATPAIPGNRPYKVFAGSPLIPKPTYACTHCGACAVQCPAGAISRDDVAQVDSGRCIACMRCVAICPHNARMIPPEVTAAVQARLKPVCSTRKDNELYV